MLVFVVGIIEIEYGSNTYDFFILDFKLLSIIFFNILIFTANCKSSNVFLLIITFNEHSLNPYIYYIECNILPKLIFYTLFLTFIAVYLLSLSR